MASSTALQYSTYYHIFNRGNNRENIFIEARNYPYFLKLWEEYIEPVADTFAYCLLRNHFHAVVGVRAAHEIPRGVKSPSQQFSNLFNAYAKTINKAYHRTGSLFQNPFKRYIITTNTYFVRLVVYIHQNPQKHGFVDDFRLWPHSSYSNLLSDAPSRLCREAVMNFFGGRSNLLDWHQVPVDEDQVKDLIQDD